MNNYLVNVVQSTVVAAVITLVWRLLGIDHTWAEAGQTYGVAFLSMFALGLWSAKKKENESK